MRALRKGLIVLFVLAVLFIAADRVALLVAEGEAAERIKKAEGVSSTADTSIDIKGFPFLTQVAAKELEQVDAELSGMTTKAGDEQLTVTRVDARLRHVRLSGNYSSAVADQATGTALISYDDLTKAAQDGVRVSWGGKDERGKGRVKVSASITLLGQTFKRSVTSSVSVSGGDTVKLRADKVPGGSIPGLEDTIRGKIDFTREISGLPAGLELEKVVATKKGVELSVRGRGVELGG
ncbi:MAG: LmeA family phospholipid-binding protein [Streptomyces sp.]|uniref:LmeA family phospholipid-binding protein n=1 Tax=Streptomyces sp. TaxID=1931 RepID=UPI003D6BFEE2